MIAGISIDRVIGKDGKIPWYSKEDLERLRMIITGQNIVMGRKTFESLKNVYPNDFGHPLAGKNIVLSRTLKIPGQKIYENKTDLLRDFQDEDLIIIGGGEIYSEFLDLSDELDLTIISGKYDGDTYFPKFEHLFEKKDEFRGIYEKIVFEKRLKIKSK